MIELKLQQCRLDNRYDVEQCLGRGSYAEIYVAHDNAAQNGEPSTVVIKALNVLLQGVPDVELERTLIENFQNEAVALDRVRHPNIISRLGHGTAIDLASTTFHYLVLEYLSGGDLAARCRQQAFPLDRALFYLEQVCAGLAHAHLCGVIHRDIKPQNLLLTDDCRIVKIADFGVAKIEGGDGVITRVGTNIYAPPEHNPLSHTGQLDASLLAGGAQPHLTPAADIYSLAKTTYTLLAGESPRRFAQRPITEFPASIAAKPWAPAVLDVLRRATQTSAAARPQTVQEFWAELSDAALPPTQMLRQPDGEATLFRPDTNLSSASDVLPVAAPPRPRFDTTRDLGKMLAAQGKERPRIVVPVTGASTGASVSRAAAQEVSGRERRQTAHEALAGLPDARAQSASHQPQHRGASVIKQPAIIASRNARLLVAVLLVAALAGMLYATHNYVRSRFWNTTPATPTQQTNSDEASNVGREGVATTDVNLRPEPGINNNPIGVAEAGSRVRVLSVRNNFYEVQVLQHGRAKDDPDSKDRGWLNKRYLELQ